MAPLTEPSVAQRHVSTIAGSLLSAAHIVWPSSPSVQVQIAHEIGITFGHLDKSATATSKPESPHV